MKYLITGGAGFIGSNIAHRLVKNGESVRILDNFSTGKHENLTGIENKIEIIEGDIRDYELVNNTLKGVDYVLHLAALASVPSSIKDPITSHEINVTGTLNVLEASRLAQVKKLVFSSSSAIYGDASALPINEWSAAHPLSPYAVGKLTGEYYARNYWEIYQLPTVSLRYFNVYGPKQNPDGDYAAVIPKFIISLLNNQSPVVFGDGEQSRDFIYIEDAVTANLLAAADEEMAGTEYNVGSGQRFTLNQLLEELCKITGVDLSANCAAARIGDIRHSYADIGKLKNRGFIPKADFRHGLERTVEYFKSHYSFPIIAAKVNL